MDRTGPLLGLALALTTTACGEAGVYWDVKFSPGYAPGPTTVSVLGVYQDGRMSNELRDEVLRGLAPELGQPTCEIAWDDRLRAAEPDLYEEVDRTTQSDGITEDVLDKFTEWSEGDAILVVSLNIRRANQDQRGNGSIGTMTQGGLGGSSFNRPGGPMPGSRGRTGAPLPPGAVRPNTWQGQQIRVSGILFSAKTHAPMGRIILNYLGTNIEDALRRFSKKFGEEMRGSVCKGWKLPEPKQAF